MVFRKKGKLLAFRLVAWAVAITVSQMTFPHIAHAAHAASEGAPSVLAFRRPQIIPDPRFEPAPTAEQEEERQEEEQRPVSASETVGRRSQLPQTDDVVVQKVLWVTATAYSSSPDETDGDPFTMADGSRVYFGAIATNIFPFGTRVRFPEVFGNKVFIVHDRMNSRYNGKYIVDIWHPSKQEALKFGARTVKMEVLSK